MTPKPIKIRIPAGLSPQEKRAAICDGLRDAAREIADEIVRDALRDASPKGNA